MDLQQALWQLVNDEFALRRERNQAYSLRAYARDLDMAPSALSEVLNRRRPLSIKNAKRILPKIGAENAVIDGLIKTLDASREEAKGKTRPRYATLNLDVFASLSNWYYFAILALIEVKGFKSDATWIAKRLGISVAKARSAVRTLERLGCIEFNKQGQIVNTKKRFASTDGVPSATIQNAHKTNLKLASKALEETALEKRDFTFTNIAINPDKIPTAKKMIRDFYSKLVRHLESGEKREVYRFAASFFPLTQPQDPAEE